jgi:hypothetical protein
MKVAMEAAEIWEEVGSGAQSMQMGLRSTRRIESATGPSQPFFLNKVPNFIQLICSLQHGLQGLVTEKGGHFWSS